MSKNSKKSQYLGSMVLNNQKVIDISPMYDIFLQYAFKNNTGANILAKATNIFITELKFMEGTFAYMPKIEGEVSVDTQYAYIISKESKGSPRTQDLKLTSQKRRAFIELQNRINKKTNVVKRAFDYFILGITWNNREETDQIWFLAETQEEVFNGRNINVYAICSVFTGELYPIQPKMMFVDLSKIAENSITPEAQELAQYLLGQRSESNLEEVSEIIAFFNERFEEFREDKEVKDVMSFWEELLEEREYIAKLEGNTEGEIRTLYMRLKMTIKEIAKELSLTDDYVTKVLQEKGLLG